MPRFFFNISDGRDFKDTEGMEFPDWHAARRHAIRYAGKVLDNEAEQLELNEDWRMEVSDDRGLLLFRLDFNVFLAAAVGTRPRGLPANSN